ncbi:MAG: HAD-IIB family hydrolase [candidate division WOR-3 bacterium]|jgi:sucrose-6F-phosphate phosphohydrolase
MDYIFISDIDDTLIGNDQSLRRFNNVISSLREKFFLVYSSGRFKGSLLSVVAEHNLLQSDAIICNVGTEIYYAPSWKEDKEWEKMLEENWKKEEITTILKDFPVEEQPYDKKFTASYYVKAESIVGKIKKALKDFEVKVIHTKGHLLDIIPEKAGKGNAAKFLQKSKNLPTVCSGDSENDIDMLIKCDSSILVGNAEKTVKEQLSTNKKVYQAKAEYALGVLEGLRSFQVIEEKNE